MKNSKLRFKIKNYIFIVCAGIFLVAGSVAAAEISVTSAGKEIGVNQRFEAAVSLNAKGENINALEGSLTFPADIILPKEIRDGNSIVNFWVERPKIVGGNTINFSGIIPGGYAGSGPIFSVIFETKKPGNGWLEIKNGKILLNDGSGTETRVEIFNFQFLVSEGGAAPPVSEIKDVEPPESFVPQVGREEGIFDGKWFVAFATQDKISGIDRFEIQEKFWPFCFLSAKWQKVESPFRLKDQWLNSCIYVKAVDRLGNERIVKLEPPRIAPWYENFAIWSIIIVCSLALFFGIKLLWRRKK